jgi:transcriptional regulator with XRE-family HTH domain
MPNRFAAKVREDHKASMCEDRGAPVLQELRERHQVSQVAVADKLGIRQPTVSKIERREDVNVSTLRRYVQALGGELHITVRFRDGAVEIGRAPRGVRAGR